MEERIVFVLVYGDRTIPLSVGSFVIGRAPDVDIVCDGKQLSRRHARLVVSEAAVDVEDLGSTNGTWVDSYLVQHRLSVKQQAKLKLGDVEMMLQPVRARMMRDPVITTTARDGISVPPEHAEAVTQQTSAFEHLRSSLSALMDANRLDAVKDALDPVLAELELSSRPPSDGAIDAIALVALRFALASRVAAYVDTVVRVHYAHDHVMSEPTLALLDECITNGLSPDPRNADEYVERMRGKPTAVRIEAALSGDGNTVPAPAPDSQR